MKIPFQILQKLNDEGVELIWAADKGSIAFTSVLSSSSDLAKFIGEVVEAFASNNIHITHLETRQNKSEKELQHPHAKTRLEFSKWTNKWAKKYEDDDYQPLYFVAQSIQDALYKLREYALSMVRPFAVIYDPFTRSVETIRTISDLEPAFSRFRMEFSSTTYALDKLNINTSK
ncbi:hypothetical protein OESDEN_13386 [Oesophagostomum dentatum]|uniref:Biopterin-dependent aromatic amino acid hydroxylase family profile domain-containing protein n=1 Tax=Oesophagostomum dentatum TaxID=61180 RepID=A0A0B1SPG3_OESDE|nr:hypothetical protein OESDEN_13386 [Oesophagostomum dentatum]